MTTARGEPAQVAVLPGNSVLPFVMAVVTRAVLLASPFHVYNKTILTLLGVVALSLR